MAWHEWNQNDLPCLFTSERARENQSYLENLLGSRFSLYINSPGNRHALVDMWRTTGSGAFLEINALAEDLRLVESKKGIDSVLNDLCDNGLCLPTWHMIHTAGLFERARTGTVLEFIEGGESERPDFIVLIDGCLVPVEAKLLTQSQEEVRFLTVAKQIDKVLSGKDTIVPMETAVYVIFKNPISRDISKEALEFYRKSILRYRGTAIRERGDMCNIFMEPSKSPEGFSEYRVGYIMAPVPDEENIRVLQRAKKASKQLRSWPSAPDAGILSVGLSDNQDGVAVFTHISNRIRQGRLGGISALLLLKRRTHLAPPCRTTLDLLEIRKNKSAFHPVPGKIPLRPLGAAALLTKVEPYIGGIRSYRLGFASGRLTNPAKAVLPLPDIRVLTKDMLV